MLWDWIKAAMLESIEKKIFEGKAEMTYEEAVIYAELFAKRINNEKCCAILCGSEMAGSLALLACFAAGVTAVPLSARYGHAHSDRIIETIDPTSIITDIDGELRVIHISDSSYKEPQEHPALIMCTSGTTGKPKGVMLSEKNIITNVSDIAEYFNVNKTDTILISRPLYHCAVITGEFILSLIKGASICFYSNQFNPKALWDIITEKNITVFCGTPTMLEMMARYKNKSLDCPLRKISVSGERMTTAAACIISDTFRGADIYNVYGLTEACPRVSYLPPHLIYKFPFSVGYPLRSVDIKIIKDDGNPAAQYEKGILWVKGDNVMIGYYNNPELTDKVKKNGWLCTGDIAFYGPYNLLCITGRSDDLIIRAGVNIYPQEIEEAMKKDRRVKEILVYGFNSPHSGMQIGMKVSGEFKNVQEVRKLCIDILPKYEIPLKIELLDELPKNASGKIVRRIIND